MPSPSAKPASLNDWQIQEIRTAIEEADADDFATDGEVKALMDKWDADTE